MKQQTTLMDKETLAGINELKEAGIREICIILRHSARHYSTDAGLEPFMGLTQSGKNYAFGLGLNLPLKPHPEFFSSYIGRCIETACLIDKGYSKTHGRFNRHNIVAHELAPFYINNFPKAVAMADETGEAAFIRSWFSNLISQAIMAEPQAAADTLLHFLRTRLSSLQNDQMTVCVSHDWNLFLLKEFKLGLRHEDYGNIGFLESVLLFKKNKKLYITNHQQTPVLLP